MTLKDVGEPGGRGQEAEYPKVEGEDYHAGCVAVVFHVSIWLIYVYEQAVAEGV